MLSEQLLTSRLPLDKQIAFYKLSSINQLHFTLIWLINSISLFCFPIIILLNLRSDNFAFAIINTIYLVFALLPTLYACYQLKIKFSLYYSLCMYYVTIIGYYTTSIIKGIDTHCEVLFIAHAIFCVIFLNKKQSIVLSALVFFSFIVCRYYIELFPVKPINQGFLVNSLSVFMALFILIYYVKILTIKNSVNNIRERQILHRDYLKLTEISKLKDKTFGMIGHDLRSPIAVLKTQLMLLRSSVDNNRELSKHSQELSTLVDSIQSLLDNIYHWSMLQQNALISRKVQLNLSDIAEDALHSYEHYIASKLLKLETKFDKAFITGDEYQLLVLVRNLIQNAVKFTPVSGVVRIETGALKNEAYLLVVDTGIGFPETIKDGFMANVPQRWGTIGEKGSGMGLPIIKGLAKLNNGCVHYESTPGKGTTAKITFNKTLTHPQ